MWSFGARQPRHGNRRLERIGLYDTFPPAVLANPSVACHCVDARLAGGAKPRFGNVACSENRKKGSPGGTRIVGLPCITDLVVIAVQIPLIDYLRLPFIIHTTMSTHVMVGLWIDLRCDVRAGATFGGGLKRRRWLERQVETAEGKRSLVEISSPAVFAYPVCLSSDHWQQLLPSMPQYALINRHISSPGRLRPCAAKREW